MSSEALGSDLRGGLRRCLFTGTNPAGLGPAILVFAGLIIINLVLQSVLTIVFQLVFFEFNFEDKRQLTKAAICGLFPAGLAIFYLSWQLAKWRGGDPWGVLNLRKPDFGRYGWPLVIAGFIVAMYAFLILAVTVFNIDVAQYTPGPDGQSPETGSAGDVKEAMFDIANELLIFLLALPGVAIGAPLAEEAIFRGQIFTAPARTRLGFSGTSVLTSLVWSLMHMTEPWFSIIMIFFMGLIFGWMLYRFGSLWVTIICHGAWNLGYALIIFTTLQP
jgi:membrane protease YdiL (CAAX protease family)